MSTLGVVAPSYPLKQTAEAWGISHDHLSTYSSLMKVFLFIKRVANAPLEVTTDGPSQHSELRVNGALTQPSLAGHLILNPRGVDLRFAAGNVAGVSYAPGSGDNFQAHFFNRQGGKILSVDFKTKEPIEVKTVIIDSRQGKLKAIDKSQSVETLWRSLTDVHHFYPMLQQLGIGKLEAFNQVPDELARQVAPESALSVLKEISRKQHNIMIFVGNDTAYQVYTGPVKKIVELTKAGKIVVHGETAEGHKAVFKLVQEAIDQAWVINKNSAEGLITSLEIFDKEGNHIAQFNGIRKEGGQQDTEWVALMKKLPFIA